LLLLFLQLLLNLHVSSVPLALRTDSTVEWKGRKVSEESPGCLLPSLNLPFPLLC
jgi:hypothetical protein